MEEILKELMNSKCVSMHNNQFRCYGKGCNGQCPMFLETLIKLEEKTKPRIVETMNVRLGYHKAGIFTDEAIGK